MGYKTKSEKINLPIGAALRAERERQGVSQKELAKRVGRDLASVSRHETEDKAPCIELLCVYARALGVLPSQLVSAAEKIWLQRRRWHEV